MKHILLSLLFLVLYLTTYSQLFVPKEDIPKFIVGFHSGGVIAFGKDTLDNNFHEILLETEPYFCYFPVKNLGFGLMFNYMYVNSTLNNYDNYYSFGFLTRYYIPFQINKTTLKKQKIYLEYNINLTNYSFINRYGYPTVYNKLEKIRNNFVIGLNINLINEFYFDLGLQYLKFFDGIGFFEPRIAIEYHFNK